MELLFKERILGKYEVGYYFSKESGIMQTEKPFWLEDAYSNVITKLDIGLVYRNLLHANILELFLANRASNGAKTVLDLGGGFGLLARLLRDKGINAYTHDPYCENVFAKDFEPGPDFKADTLLAFEVFEHLEDPVVFLTEAFEKYKCKTIFFSTVTFSHSAPAKDWWYYSFETGQHISFYQPQTLDLLAKRFNCRYYSMGRDFHLITDQRISPFILWLYKNKWALKIALFFTRLYRRKKSFLMKDYEEIKKKLQYGQS